MSEGINFSALLEAFAEPFSVMDVEWKPGALNKEKTKALALAYVDSRAYIQRLNSLTDGNWSDDYQVILLPDRVAVICRLTIFNTTRTGDGECLLTNVNGNDEGYVEANAVTTASAQAFKRACVKFGLGAYLYNLPQKWCDYDARTRRIVEPPDLPEWALPYSEKDAYKAAKTAVSNNGKHVATAAAPAPAETPAPAPATTKIAQPVSIPFANPGEDPAEYIIPFGKNKGKTLLEVWNSGKDGIGWIKWAANEYQPKNENDISQRMAKAFLLLQGLQS